MAWLLIFNFFEILQTLKIYEDNVIQRSICQNTHQIKKILGGSILFKVALSVT